MISIFNNVCHATPHNGYYALVGLVFFHLIFPILVYMAFFYVFYFNLCDFAIIQFRFFCLLFQQTIHHLDNRMFSSYSACHNVLHYKRERETYCRFVQRIDLLFALNENYSIFLPIWFKLRASKLAIV